MTGARDIQAAGAVVFRPGKEVLLVHRPKYDDWAFPKGKLERGEQAVAAAVREVYEETGVHVRLMRPLRPQRYPVRRQMKTVRYWVGSAVDDDATDVSAYEPNDEIDQVAWMPVDKALRTLTYRYDRATLREAVKVRKKTRALVVLRHAEAWSRRAWHADDRLRPLLIQGRRQAAELVPVLAAFDPATVITSSSRRCVDTVEPYAAYAHLSPVLTTALTEEDATRHGVRALVAQAVADLTDADGVAAHGTLICSHAPVLPLIFDALDVGEQPLDKAELVVFHLRKGEVVATERHRIR